MGVRLFHPRKLKDLAGRFSKYHIVDIGHLDSPTGLPYLKRVVTLLRKAQGGKKRRPYFLVFALPHYSEQTTGHAAELVEKARFLLSEVGYHTFTPVSGDGSLAVAYDTLSPYSEVLGHNLSRDLSTQNAYAGYMGRVLPQLYFTNMAEEFEASQVYGDAGTQQKKVFFYYY